MRILVLVLVLLSGFSPVMAEEAGTRPPIERTIAAWANVDAEGRVIEVEFEPGMPTQIVESVRPSFVGMSFDPAFLGDKPAASRTAVNARVAFLPDGGLGYTLRVIEVIHVGAFSIRVAPRYPFEAMREGVGGKLWLEVLVNADGSVDAGEIRLLEARFHRAGKAYKGRRIAALLEDAARNALAQWTFEQPQIAGAPVVTRQQVPVKFTPPGHGPGGRPDFDYGDFARRSRNLLPVSVDAGQRLPTLRTATAKD